MHTIQEFNKHKRRLKALGYSLKYPKLTLQCLKQNIETLFNQGGYSRSALPTLQPEELLSAVTLQNFALRNGNPTYLELLIIASIISSKKPHTLLEVGTFDGVTTLQMALNSPKDATIHTIDLPPGGDSHLPITTDDVEFVTDTAKNRRKYQGTPIESKIIQHFGDSTDYDFAKFGEVDFCFIDAGHSYACVKSDTENTLRVLSKKGTILWHDFNPGCPGVFQYLTELQLPLYHIKGTSLIIFYNNGEAG